MHDYDEGVANDASGRRDIADEIEIQFVVERRVDRVRRTRQQKCVAVRWGTHDRFGADVAAAARPVLDHEWLANPLRQPLTDQTRDDVGRSAGSEWDDNPHGPRWIGLRPCKARHGVSAAAPA